MKKGFPFYRSYFEQLKHLENEQIAIIVMSICRVQFFELHIEHVEFEDKMLKLAWSGIKHSIKKSLEGYCAKMNINYDDTLAKGLGEVLAENEKRKENENEEVKGIGEEKPSSLAAIDIETDANRVAKYLLQKILEKKPNFKQPDISTWEQDIEKTIKIDKRTVQELIGCINWIYSSNGSFWIPNVLSAQKLREKFDVMESQMVNNPRNQSRNKTAQVLAKGGY